MCIRDSLYAVQKEILRRMYGLELGGVRAPLPNLIPEDEAVVAEAQRMICLLYTSTGEHTAPGRVCAFWTPTPCPARYARRWTACI